LSAHTAATRTEHKSGLAFIAARAKHESALSDLRVKEAALLACREKTHQQSGLILGKEHEIDELKHRKTADDVSVGFEC